MQQTLGDRPDNLLDLHILAATLSLHVSIVTAGNEEMARIGSSQVQLSSERICLCDGHFVLVKNVNPMPLADIEPLHEDRAANQMDSAESPATSSAPPHQYPRSLGESRFTQLAIRDEPQQPFETAKEQTHRCIYSVDMRDEERPSIYKGAIPGLVSVVMDADIESSGCTCEDKGLGLCEFCANVMAQYWLQQKEEETAFGPRQPPQTFASSPFLAGSDSDLGSRYG
eukprot:3231741-Amphidinium_carterae.1